jgi:heptosyltransferase II
VKILIVKLGALGDVLRTTSLLPGLRRRHRGARVWWLTSPAAKPLLEGHPGIDRLVTSPRKLPRDFDLVLSLEEAPACAKAAREACAGRLVGVTPEGFTPDSALYYAMSLLNPDKKAADRMKAANRLTYAELWFKILGLPGRPAAPTLAVRAGRPTRAIGFNPGAGARWPAKQLTEAKAASVLRALDALGRPVILLGGRDERARNRRILKRAGCGIDGGTGHDLKSFARLIGRCETIVSTDSLAFHLATALRRKAVVLVGPTSAAELDAFGRGRKLVARECACFYKPRCVAATHCLDSIPDEAVARAAA